MAVIENDGWVEEVVFDNGCSILSICRRLTKDEGSDMAVVKGSVDFSDAAVKDVEDLGSAVDWVSGVDGIGSRQL